MDDLYYYGWVLDVDDDVCVRGVGGVYITFRDVLCWMLAGFFSKPPPNAPPPLS